ncbi:MAG: APC family permease [Oligoflexia bacterium]|nr:APC family permease [Oligoflexia bacterium]
MNLSRAKRFLLGQPLSSHMASHERIPKWKGLAVLSSDALSSVAYATEEILIPLALVGVAALAYSVPISLAIVILIAIVTLSYRQTIEAYPGGSGAYFVVKENLGVRAGLVAGAALLIDYTLTVAVSVAAGVENIASAVPFFQAHKEAMGAIIILMIMFFNLRGVRESASIFALPTYLFILSFLILIAVGIWKLATGAAVPEAPLIHETYPVIPTILLLRAFSSGCAALSGIEAISDGVSLFRPPMQKNAKITLVWMAVILSTLFLGITSLSHIYGVIPHEHETAVSVLGRKIFGESFFYYVLQGSTAMILILAANTAYSDFPRLSSFLAKDRFLPRQLASLGDRLVFSNGILGLSLAAAFLIFIFKGDTHHLIPLYAVGVFLSFTLSQAGMVRHHLRKREKGWVGSIFFNLTGAMTTFVVLVVIASTKFAAGAWMVILLIPIFVIIFMRINAHYLEVGKQLSLIGQEAPPRLEPIKHTVIVPISGIHRGVIDALRYALSISNDVRACYVEIDPETTERVKAEWKKWAREIPFVVLKSPYRSVIAPLLDYIDDVEQTTHDEMLTVVIPEFVTAKWWQQVLHNQTAFLIRAALMFRRRKVVTSVRYHLKGT